MLQQKGPIQQCPAGQPHPIQQCCRDLVRPLGDVFRAMEGRQFHNAKNLLVSLAAKYPDRPCILRLLWQVNEHCNLSTEAVHACHKLAELPPKWPAVFWARIASAARRSSFSEAWGSYVQMRELFPQLPLKDMPQNLWDELMQSMHWNLRASRVSAVATAARGCFPRQAQEPLRIMVTLLANHLNIAPCRLLWPGRGAEALGHLQQVPALVRQGRLETALRICNHWRGSHPDQLPAAWNCLILLLWLERFSDAFQLLREMQQVGFPLEDVAEAWAAYFAAARPWVEARKNLPLLRVQLSLDQFRELLSRPEIYYDEGSYGDSHEPLELKLQEVFLLAPAPNTEREEVGRVFVVKAAAYLERTPTGSVRLIWHAAEPWESVRQHLGDILRIEPEVFEDPSLAVRGERAFPNFYPRLVVRAPDLPGCEQQRLEVAYLSRRLENEFPFTPRPELDGKTPLDAAKDEDLRPRVLGLVLCLAEDPRLEKVISTLRQRLGFEEPPVIDPRQRDVRCLPPIALRRVDVRYLTPGQVAWLRERFPFLRSTVGQRLVWSVVRHRPELREEFSASQVLRLAIHLIMSCCDKEAARQIVEEARALGNPSHWDLPIAELVEFYYLAFVGYRDDFATLFWQLRDKYWNDRKVRGVIYDLLKGLGLIHPQGTLPEWLREKGGVVSRVSRDEGLAGPLPASPTGAAGESAGLWLPPHVRDPEAEKRRLWLPGQP